jgi:hypothetical protein
MYENVEKGLEKIDNPLIKQTVEFLIAKIDESDTDESADIAKSALLLYLNAAAPQLLKANVAVERALTKSYEDAGIEETVDAEKRLKKLLADSGIYYFGPLSKHNTNFGRIGDPKAPGDKRHPHAAGPAHEEEGGVPMGAKLPSQAGHNGAAGPGKREIISTLRDLQELTGIDTGSREELKGMSPAKLHQLMEHHLPGYMERFMHGSGRENKAASGFGWQNTVQSDRLRNLKNYLSSPSAPRSIGRESKSEVLNQVNAIQSIPEANRRGGRTQHKYPTPEPGADLGAPESPVEGVEENKLPEKLSSMNQVPKDNIMWQNYERLKPSIRRKIQDSLSESPRLASDMNAVINAAVKNPVNLSRVGAGRSSGNQEPPKWLSQEAADNPNVAVDRETQHALARSMGIKLPENEGERAEREAWGAVADKERRKREGIKRRSGGARSVTGGDVRNAVAENNQGFDLAMEPAALKALQSLASDMRRRGVDKDEALNLLANLMVNLDSALSRATPERPAGIKMDQKEEQAVMSDVNKLLNRLNAMGYSDLASYFRDKLNTGETVHAVFAGMPKLKKSLDEEAEPVEKFTTLLEKIRNRKQAS